MVLVCLCGFVEIVGVCVELIVTTMGRDKAPKRPRNPTTPSLPVVPTQNVPTPNANRPFLGLKKLTREEKMQWNELKKRPIIITNFLDVSTVQQFGLEPYVQELMKNAGLGGFYGQSADTYRRYTLEFLATLDKYVETDGSWWLKFNVDDNPIAMSFEHMRQLFGVKKPSGEFVEGGLESEDFWSELTGRTCKKSNLKANVLSHPAWKLFYRGLANTWLGNGEPSSISLRMVKYLMSGLSSVKVVPDWVDLFVTKCLSYRESDAGNIAVGGMITIIAEDCVGELSEDAGYIGTGLYTADWLNQYDKFKRASGDGCRFIYGNPQMRINCQRGVFLPRGPMARDWRMLGIEDAFDEADPPARDEDMGEPEAEGHNFQEQQQQGGVMGHWDEMRQYLEAQSMEDRRVQRENFERLAASTQYQYGEISDRFEGVEDTLAYHGARFTQLEQWASQTEPRLYQPVPDEYMAMMESRAEARRQRQSSRRSRHEGSSSSSYQ